VLPLQSEWCNSRESSPGVQQPLYGGPVTTVSKGYITVGDAESYATRSASFRRGCRPGSVGELGGQPGPSPQTDFPSTGPLRGFLRGTNSRPWAAALPAVASRVRPPDAVNLSWAYPVLILTICIDQRRPG
jgi:hypothetical protein